MKGRSTFEVSVIIPVYHAEKYLEEAVISALQHQCVKEVLLVEDRSPDNALFLCKELERNEPRVKLLQHPGGENRGAGASRNLGIRNAACEYVAFLDADDWYLPNRFDAELKLFADPAIDGVYGATAVYDNEKGLLDLASLSTVKASDSNTPLLMTLLTPGAGRFTTDAITVRKSLLDKTGLFETSLRLHQDTHLWLRLAHNGNLVKGITEEAICVRRVHHLNRIATKNVISRQLLYEKVFETFLQYQHVYPPAFRMIFKRYLSGISTSRLKQLFEMLRIIGKNPSILNKLF